MFSAWIASWGEEVSRPKKRSELANRWQVLVLLCVGLMGSYYCCEPALG